MQGRLMLSAGKPLETPTENHSHPKVPCWERTARQGVFIWHGGGEEENGDQGKMMARTQVGKMDHSADEAGRISFNNKLMD